jgi:1,2-diacylglycerol 3-alpha-glucosyltransferase
MAMSLHICLFSDDFQPAVTGVGVHLGLVAPELVRRGHRVSMVTTRRSGQPEREVWLGVDVIRMPSLKVYDFYQALPLKSTIRRLLAADPPSLVHHHYFGLMMRRACAVAGAMGLPQVSTYHFDAEILTQPRPMRFLRPWIQREMVRVNNACNLVISPSATLVRGLADLGVRVPIRYISNPVAFSDVADVEPAPRSAGFTLLYAGRLGPEKNIGFLIRAFAQLRVSVPDAVLWIAGRGPEQPALARLCAQLGVSDQVQFLGFLDHPTLARHYAACDAFVLPSLREVQPLAAMEAMWFARPVILTSAIAAARELVTDGDNGFIVDPDSDSELAQRLLQLARQPELRLSMGCSGRAKAEAFRPAAAVDALALAYHDVLR